MPDAKDATKRVAKGSLSTHPVVGALWGFAVFGALMALDHLPLDGVPVLGSSGGRMLLLLAALGWLLKFAIRRQLARGLSIEPMSAHEFAGVEEEEARRLAEAEAPGKRAPLPPVEPEARPLHKATWKLDFAQIEGRSRELEALGFSLQAEGAARFEGGAQVPVFLRLFRHPAGHWAEVYQGFPRGMPPTPATVTILTYFEGGWALGDTTSQGNWALWMLRRMRAIGRSHEPGTPASEMWRAHAEKSGRVAGELGLSVLALGVDGYLQQARETMAELRRLTLRRSIWLAWAQVLVARLLSPLTRGRPQEWWGEFPRAVRERQAALSSTPSSPASSEPGP